MLLRVLQKDYCWRDNALNIFYIKFWFQTTGHEKKEQRQSLIVCKCYDLWYKINTIVFMGFQREYYKKNETCFLVNGYNEDTPNSYEPAKFKKKYREFNET